MPMYAYKGVGSSGKAASGVRDAESPKALRQLLRKDGVLVTSFELSRGGKLAKEVNARKGGLSRDVDLGGLIGGVKKVEIAAFTRQMATLVKAGIPLADALGALVEQVTNVRFKAPLSEVRSAVNEGSSFGDALARHPKLFDELFVSMVRAGEVAGNLDEVLTRLADFLEGSQKLKSKVTSAMVYPAVMVVVGSIIMAVLMIKVIPNITTMFKQQGKTLPINTRMLIATSDFARNWWWALGFGLIAANVLFVNWTRGKEGRMVWDSFALRLPEIGRAH